MKNCDGCVACCNGTLVADIYGEIVNRGNPCSRICYENMNCSKYNERPPVCSNYKCLWLLRADIPEWMKPSESGVLLNAMEDYIMVHSVNGMDLKADVLLAVINYAYSIGMNLKFFIETKNTPYGNQINGSMLLGNLNLAMSYQEYE